jgi:hypothetical protein
MSKPGLVRWLRTLGRASLVLVCPTLPFEMTAPLARLGPLVHEHATWLSERGNLGLRQPVEVRGPAAVGGSAGTGRVPDGGGRSVPSDLIPRRALWRAAVAAWREHPLLGLGPDNFRHRLAYFFEFTPTDALWWLLGGMVVALGRPPAEAAA